MWKNILSRTSICFLFYLTLKKVKPLLGFKTRIGEVCVHVYFNGPCLVCTADPASLFGDDEAEMHAQSTVSGTSVRPNVSTRLHHRELYLKEKDNVYSIKANREIKSTTCETQVKVAFVNRHRVNKVPGLFCSRWFLGSVPAERRFWGRSHKKKEPFDLRKSERGVLVQIRQSSPTTDAQISSGKFIKVEKVNLFRTFSDYISILLQDALCVVWCIHSTLPCCQSVNCPQSPFSLRFSSSGRNCPLFLSNTDRASSLMVNQFRSSVWIHKWTTMIQTIDVP